MIATPAVQWGKSTAAPAAAMQSGPAGLANSLVAPPAPAHQVHQPTVAPPAPGTAPRSSGHLRNAGVDHQVSVRCFAFFKTGAGTTPQWASRRSRGAAEEGAWNQRGRGPGETSTGAVRGAGSLRGRSRRRRQQRRRAGRQRSGPSGHRLSRPQTTGPSLHSRSAQRRPSPGADAAIRSAAPVARIQGEPWSIAGLPR